MRHNIIHKVIVSFISLVILALGVCLGVLGFHIKASDNSFSVNTYSINVNVSSSGDGRIYEYLFFENKKDNLKEIYFDVNYLKDTCGFSSPASFSTDDVSCIIQDGAGSFSFNSTSNVSKTSSYTYGNSFEADNNTDIKGNKLIAENGHQTFYIGRTKAFSEYFNVSLNYTIKNFATIFKDQTYVDMNFNSAKLPINNFTLTLTYPSGEVKDDLSVYPGFFNKGTEETNTSYYRLNGKKDNYYNGVKASGVFSSLRMDKKETLIENNRPYIDQNAPSYLKLHAHLHQSNIVLMVTTFIAAVFVISSLVFIVLIRRKKVNPKLNQENNSFELNPLLLNMLGFDYYHFEDSIIKYYLFRRKMLAAIKDKKTTMYRLESQCANSKTDEVFISLFKEGDYPLEGLRGKIRKNRFKLMKACNEDSYKDNLLISKFPFINLKGIVVLIGLVLSIVLFSLSLYSSYNILLGCVVIVFCLLYSDISFSSYRLTNKGKEVIDQKIREVSSLNGLEEGLAYQKAEKELCPYYSFMLKKDK